VAAVANDSSNEGVTWTLTGPERQPRLLQLWLVYVCIRRPVVGNRDYYRDRYSHFHCRHLRSPRCSIFIDSSHIRSNFAPHTTQYPRPVGRRNSTLPFQRFKFGGGYLGSFPGTGCAVPGSCGNAFNVTTSMVPIRRLHCPDTEFRTLEGNFHCRWTRRAPSALTVTEASMVTSHNNYEASMPGAWQ